MTELTYTKNGDYQIPDLKLSEEPESKPLGKYGMLRKTYLSYPFSCGKSGRL